MSKAHVSDAMTQAGCSRPGAAGIRPMARGRNPLGSRAAISASSVRIASENAPWHWCSASTMRATAPLSWLCAAKCRISSVSDDELNSVPRSTSRSRIDRALDRLPLCASARCPSRSWATKGWMLAGFVALPDVEYRVCPMAASPRSVVSNRSSSSNTSRTRPKSLCSGITLRPLASSRTLVTIPADSWPRCWSACRPKYVSRAASGWLKTPKMPQWSRGLSTGVLRRRRRGGGLPEVNGGRRRCVRRRRFLRGSDGGVPRKVLNSIAEFFPHASASPGEPPSWTPRSRGASLPPRRRGAQPGGVRGGGPGGQPTTSVLPDLVSGERGPAETPRHAVYLTSPAAPDWRPASASGARCLTGRHDKSCPYGRS